MESKVLFMFIATFLGADAVDHVTVDKFQAVTLYGGTARNDGMVLLRDTNAASGPDFQFKGVCSMTESDAKVACKMLGYSSGQLKRQANGAAVTSTAFFPLYQTYGCKGTETSLYECPNVANKVLLAAPGTCDPVENAHFVVCGPAECLAGDGTNGYAVLDATNRWTSKTGKYYCDITTAPSWTTKSSDWQGDLKWYRFGTGSEKLAKSVPETGRCGTNIGAFSPSALPVNYGYSRRITLCYGKDNTCLPNRSGKVTNCGSFFVYQLPDVPYCSLRYCAVKI